jgi:hypothetical protein
MKAIKIVQVVLLIAVVGAAVGCSTRGGYNDGYYSGPNASMSLIIGPSPNLHVVRHPNGLYYYRAPGGYTYWRGYDNRYYLDRRHMSRSYYNHRQYNDWRRYHKYRRR